MSTKTQSEKQVKRINEIALSKAIKEYKRAQIALKEQYDALKEQIFDRIGFENGRFEINDVIIDVNDESSTTKYRTDKLVQDYPWIADKYSYQTTQARRIKIVKV